MGSAFSIVLAIVGLSQLYWFWRASVRIRKAFRKTSARLTACAAVLAVFFLMLAYNVGWLNGRTTPIHLTPGEILLGAPFTLWIACSLVAFLLLAVFRTAAAIVRAPFWAARKLRAGTPAADTEAPPRRVFLQRTANVVASAPFVAGVYGLFKGRLDLETTRQPIRVARLPGAFEGFRIAQLSDIHIGPFMTQEEIRKYVRIANALKPDLTVLTGDFVTWDPATQYGVVEALSGLQAPFGVFGCLGNHDAYARVQDSITLLFQQVGIRILRHQSIALAIGGESLNLIGIDYTGQFVRSAEGRVADPYLESVKSLIDPNRVNILLSHNPNTFDRAAALGADLSLAGHTHGGQAALEFVSPELAPSRLVTPYVAGLFVRPGGQLYVNRGIGTIGVPIRIGAPPEITLFELTRV